MICLKKVPSGRFNIAMKHGHFSVRSMISKLALWWSSFSRPFPDKLSTWGWLWSWFSQTWPSIQLSSGYLTFRHGKLPICRWFRWFTYKKWWFPMAMLNNQMVNTMKYHIFIPTWMGMDMDQNPGTLWDQTGHFGIVTPIPTHSSEVARVIFTQILHPGMYSIPMMLLGGAIAILKTWVRQWEGLSHTVYYGKEQIFETTNHDMSATYSPEDNS